MPELHVIDHPLITHKMTLMRKKQTSTGQFRLKFLSRKTDIPC